MGLSCRLQRKLCIRILPKIRTEGHRSRGTACGAKVIAAAALAPLLTNLLPQKFSFTNVRPARDFSAKMTV